MKKKFQLYHKKEYKKLLYFYKKVNNDSKFLDNLILFKQNNYHLKQLNPILMKKKMKMLNVIHLSKMFLSKVLISIKFMKMKLKKGLKLEKENQELFIKEFGTKIIKKEL